MFFHLSKYDWLAVRAGRGFYVMLALLGFLAYFALWTGARRVQFQRDTLATIAEQQSADYAKFRQQVADINGGQHFDGGHFGDPTNPFYFGNRMGAKFTTQPPAPLAIVAAGQSDLMPYYYKVTLSKRQALFHSEELENPQVLFNGHFDLAFVVICLLPLLIIGFTYNVVSAEREQGTLPLLLTENVSLRQVAGWRYVFRYLVFSTAFTAFVLTGLAGFGAWQPGPELALLLTAIWLYSGFWFALSYLVNSWGGSSGTNAAALVGVWLLLVLLVPTLLAVWVGRAHPMPSRVELIAKSRQIADQLGKDKTALARFYEEHPDLKPQQANPQDRTSQMLFARLQTEVALEQERALFDQQAAARRELVNNYRLLSPAVFMQQLLNQLAGTDEAHHADFEAQTSGYHQQFRDYFAPLVFKQTKLTPALVDQVPSFGYQPVSFDPWQPALWLNLGYLAAVTLLLGGLATARVRRVTPAFG
jgi:ABC-2 type transport system permease protein